MYRPRWHATLSVTAVGAPSKQRQQEGNSRLYEIPLKVAEFTLERNSFLQPDYLELVCDWQTTGLDPRLIRDGTVQFHLGCADEFGDWEPSTGGGRTGYGNCRFIGTVTTAARNSAEGAPYQVTMRALDHTDFFLRAKPFGSAGIPDFSQNLRDAWTRVCSQTPGAEGLADNIEFIGLDRIPRLSEASSPRWHRLAPSIPVPANTDAWTVWRTAVEMLGLITFIDYDRVVVTNTEGYYRTTKLPSLAWGKNILEMTEQRDYVNFANGVGMRAFDPLSGQMLEAVWPLRSAADARKKRANALTLRQTSSDPDAAIVPRYDWVTPPPGITNLKALQDAARETYRERSKQEYQGVCQTLEFVVPVFDPTTGADSLTETFDLLDLVPGDNIHIAPNEDHADLFRTMTQSEREAYLLNQGYDAEAAALIAESAENLTLLNQDFYVKSLKAVGGEDSVQFEVTYCNRILLGGETETSSDQ